MTPKEMGDLYGILSRGFLESYLEAHGFEKSRAAFLERMTLLGGRVRKNADLEPEERETLLYKGWAGNKVNVTVGYNVEFPEETMKKILVLGLP